MLAITNCSCPRHIDQRKATHYCLLCQSFYCISCVSTENDTKLCHPHCEVTKIGKCQGRTSAPALTHIEDEFNDCLDEPKFYCPECNLSFCVICVTSHNLLHKTAETLVEFYQNDDPTEMIAARIKEDTKKLTYQERFNLAKTRNLAEKYYVPDICTHEGCFLKATYFDSNTKKFTCYHHSTRPMGEVLEGIRPCETLGCGRTAHFWSAEYGLFLCKTCINFWKCREDSLVPCPTPESNPLPNEEVPFLITEDEIKSVNEDDFMLAIDKEQEINRILREETSSCEGDVDTPNGELTYCPEPAHYHCFICNLHLCPTCYSGHKARHEKELQEKIDAKIFLAFKWVCAALVLIASTPFLVVIAYNLYNFVINFPQY